MGFWWLVVWVAIAALSALLPKPENKGNQVKPADLSEWNITTATEGKRVPVLFGTRLIPLNIIWYGDLRSVAIKKKGGKK